MKIVPKKPLTITDTLRLQTLRYVLRKYDAGGDESEEAILYWNPGGDEQSPMGYFAIQTPEYYITGDTLEEVLDRIIIEQLKGIIPGANESKK